MLWAIEGALVLAGVVVQLRYLCLSQNNDYKLNVKKPFLRTYGFLLILHALLFTFILLGIKFEVLLLTIPLVVGYVGAFFILYKILNFRTKFKFTKRGRVYFIVSESIYFLSNFTVFITVKEIDVITLLTIAINITFPLIFKLMETIINSIFCNKNKKFILEQRRKLLCVNPTIIGITGSYGKTSCKKILEYFLKDTYNVVATDKNYNTPMGIALTIDKMKGNEEILIAEMGARKTGDILELCKLFPPKHAIITGVCGQHIETFGDINTIAEEKYELAKSVKGKGVCVFNTNNKYTLGMFKSFTGRKISASSNKKSSVYASGIRLSEKGSTFDLHIKKDIFLCKTNLLGRHNIQNIVLCVALATELGCDIEDLVKKMENLPQIPHRLEYSNANGINILDDGYNANFYGVKSSVECLSYFPHKRVVVSQGIVELGKESETVNMRIGAMFAKVADVVILCGINAKYIKKGLESTDFKGKTITVKSFKEVKGVIKNIVRRGDTLLLQNDIPDIY